MTDPRYPIGSFSLSRHPLPASRIQYVEEIKELPSHLRRAVSGLSGQQLDTPYRDGGWTVRQVIHHVPDSHFNAYVRLKLALTETTPMIRPYDEVAWALLQDSRTTPIAVSLTLLESLHTRWVVLWNSLRPDDFKRKFVHPSSGEHDIDWLLAYYAWHGRHHTAHITSLRERMGW